MQSLFQRPQAFFVSGWSPGETLGQWNGSTSRFLAQNSGSLHETANKNGIFLESLWATNRDKKPEDSGIEIEFYVTSIIFLFQLEGS